MSELLNHAIATVNRPENMRLWDQLGKTDPAHTKQFTRSGGFKGTAIKPMWCNLRMTEFFGPCGIGWGHTEPQFQLVPTATEVMVYCTAGIWYMDGEQKCGPVYGVGGDKVVTQIFLKDGHGQKIVDEVKGGYKTYPQTDDEAFKKAYTDAIGNAMKFIGVAADVHMGLFDDNKYVQQMKEEFRDDSTPAPQPSSAPQLRPTQAPSNGPRISEAQSKRFFAMAKSGNKSNDDIRAYLLNVCHCERSLEIQRSQYEAACKWAESIPSPTTPDPTEITDDDIPF